MSGFGEFFANRRLKDLILSIPDSLFSELITNRRITEASDYLRKAEEILLEKGLQGANDYLMPMKDKDASEGFKNSGNISHQSGNLSESLINYNKW
jgi:hypothetical protein